MTLLCLSRRTTLLRTLFCLMTMMFALPTQAWWLPGGDNNEDRGYQAEFPFNEHYQFECGACHIAYPPQVLPKASWQHLFANLNDHFGEVATPDQHQKEILSYLQDYASNSPHAGKFKDFTKRLQTPAPVRITELSFWRLKHDKVLNHKTRFITNNPDVGSSSRCNACHKDAEKGLFQKHTVSIPNIEKRAYK
ncbi:hypothetical protein [Oceanospirillum linum]|uniref:Cytochrome C n=1 Tax=Oceanospirillum linum TaxID=966 RepID=A0A1T1HE93_OCELI|nr:hypothetical protein [Oceanospirillum linum]OOV88135.1 hypothetical protein BTA35_0200870 [Oceanospirillum linum]SEF44364.1 Dihaem cytochrome c [Oleiphilus messinensis]SMP01543.1 Dihaem cytochrome c [Oceanospirillum linum]